MTVIARTNKAFFFDGVSDSIVVPSGPFSDIGRKNLNSQHDARDFLGGSTKDTTFSIDSGRYNSNICVEAWVMPDFGGIVAERENQFKLEVGSVHEPAPITFTVTLQKGSDTERHSISTAHFNGTRFIGTTYPLSTLNGIHDTNTTTLNRNHRPLLHVIGTFHRGKLQIYVNKVLMAEKELRNDAFSINHSERSLYIGGKGGQFRGVLEAFQISANFNTSFLDRTAPLRSDDTLLLYRFEEPIAPIEDTYSLSSGASANATTISISAANAKALATKLTGKSVTTGTVDFTSSPYTSGNYKVIQSTSSGTTLHDVAHVPYNLLLRPGAFDKEKKSASGLPPERVRLKSINTNGTLTIQSIHLDFGTANDGTRGLLHAHAEGVEFVVVGADLLVDTATGKPYQAPHYSSKAIDRTGQMVIDESGYEQHGFVYSSRMALSTTDTNNPYKVTWPETLSTEYSVGHSGRHILNHVDGHAYLRRLPRANEEILDLQADGNADICDIIYDETHSGLKDQISINSRADVYREIGTFNIKDIKNTSTGTVIFNTHHNSGSLSTSKREVIAIGGPNFDYEPFLLKAPIVPFGATINDETRTHHLRPSRESRVALLHVPRLASVHSMAPYVEIHYNAIDLTGASMSGTTQALLMVEKTVPAGKTAIGDPDAGTDTTVYAEINTAVSSGATLYAPGGVIFVDTDESPTFEDIFTNHRFANDSSEGYDADLTLDESQTPVNLTPYDGDDIINSPPNVVIESTSKTTQHDSSFHQLFIEPVQTKKQLTDVLDYKRREIVTSGTQANEPDLAVTASASPIFESFDIIDNIETSQTGANLKIVIQPSLRTRTNQLTHVKTGEDSKEVKNGASIHYLVSRTRVRSISETSNEEGASYTTIQCLGLQSSLASRNVSFESSASPDSHIVKELEPNAPVVSVTLGGPGQGAIDTKPTFSPSPFSHEPYSTRRAYAVTATGLSSNVLSVMPINNDAADSKSWGTYGFPKIGRVYFTDGSSAKYDSKNGTSFTFSTATLGSGDFVNGSGVEFTTVQSLMRSIGVLNDGDDSCAATVFSEPDFGAESEIGDGTTVNDRMFQAMSDVQHDYQLGTQYASTRALVEIPFFANQFFSDLVGPDSAFKVHLDATHTAHTWNPKPVGRRPMGVAPADREALSAYSIALANDQHVPTTKFISYSSPNLVVQNGSIFPDDFNGKYQNIDVTLTRPRLVFTSDGEWAIYTGVSGDTLTISTAPHATSDDFFDSAEKGATLFPGGPAATRFIQPIASDSYTPSSDFEDRSEYYYDQSSTLTQGGNVDYGLRQYVSAVEFKAGPESNPHAERIESGRARGNITSVSNVSGNQYPFVLVTLSEDDVHRFPDLGVRNLDDIQDVVGSTFYRARIEVGATAYDFHYYGFLEQVRDQTNSYNTIDLAKNTVVLGWSSGNGSTTLSNSTITSFAGEELLLVDKRRSIVNNDDFFTTRNFYTLNGTNSHAALEKEIKATYKFVTIAVAKASGTTNFVTVSGTEFDEKNLSDLFGFNLRKGDKLISKINTGSNDRYTPLGTIDYIDYDNGKIYFTANITTTATRSDTSLGVFIGDYDDREACLNTTWLNPYAPGGLRDGDTVWANMSYTNPHAVEGLFAKSRGTYNEGLVWTGFNGGQGSLDSANPRDSIPLENFLIGDTCLETARNYAQHVNKTVEENYRALGIVGSAPTVAFVDPVLATDGHARVLLYDVAHDREFIAFQDLHMQVQTSAETTHIGWKRHVVEGTNTSMTDLSLRLPTINGAAPHAWATQIDVANGFASQNPLIRSTQQSRFMESAYAHDLANKQSDDISGQTVYSDNVRKNDYSRLYGKAHGHHVHVGMSITGNADGYAYSFSTPLRTREETVSWKSANDEHELSRKKDGFIDQIVESAGDTLRDPSTFFDTPDGTRVIPAFLCLKGIRSSSLDLTNVTQEPRLQHLPQWKDMDFVRRLTVDCGEVALAEGVVDVESAASEIVRRINQYGALQARLTNGGSAHDPAVWWDADKAFANSDRGTHMGYLRAHIGRQVEDKNGNVGFTVVIHSTVPGASGRNFCVWLDNGTGQSTYNPQFLIGHGGRWRNFWALPEEQQGENMHPAPMPLDKNGRPFAPITTLTQYIQGSESGEKVTSVAEFGAGGKTDLLSLSDVLSGQNHNSINLDSFDLEGSSSTIVDGLRLGKRAIGRINFGGLAMTGVPGWAPDAGTWGFGKNGDSSFNNRYDISIASSEYTSHITSKMLNEEDIGRANLYGVRFDDHLGAKHGLRYVYKKMGDGFTNANTRLPDTIDDEICIFFDDRSVTQGGFTIGSHMGGSGDASGRGFTPAQHTASTWRGARWSPYPSPSVAVKMTLQGDTNGTKIAAIGFGAPYDASFHHDKLGYLGFPKENGVFQMSTSSTTISSSTAEGVVVTYERRDSTTFYGIEYDTSRIDLTNNNPTNLLVSPTLNWTSLVTDELLSAVTAAAVNATIDQINNPDGVAFDCTSMYAADGKTFGEWGVAEDAIRIRAFNIDKGVRPLSDYFIASVHPDLGIQAAHIELGEIEKAELNSSGVWSFGTTRAASTTEIDSGKRVDCGYIPNTLLQVRTKAVGPHVNTATPVVVGSDNKPIPTGAWKRNLNGEDYIDVSGDKILPKIDNPMVLVSATDNWSSDILTTTNDMWHFAKPCTNDATNNNVSYGEKLSIYYSETKYVTAEPHGASGFVGDKVLKWNTNTEFNWPSSLTQGYLHKHIGAKFAGLRSTGSVFSDPITYFRGGKTGPDHYVPLFFGGGFSGVTLDVNDGTMNDYSSFYTHPYANGPTGTSGIQNANEISTSFAMLDCNAIFSFFPGAALCNQHRGSPLPPFFNKSNVLSTDLDRGGTTYSSGTVKAKPSPLVLRFPHPTARYEDHNNSVDNKTTYIIFGPGQAFPFANERAANNSAIGTPSEPHPGRVITTGNSFSKVPYLINKFHNHINNTDGTEWSSYRPPTKTDYLVDAAYHWRGVINWESPAGYSLGRTYKQRPAHGRMYGQMVTEEATFDNRTQPLRHTPFLGFGIAAASDTVFHMDGGFHPGGHWMDDQITFNPAKDSNAKITSSDYSEINPTAFRVAGVLAKDVLDWTSQGAEFTSTNIDMEYIVVDGTRCQNGEELATVISAAINTFPGKGALKAMGGTHMPSMGNATRQDRYGWVDTGTVGTYEASTYPHYVESSAASTSSHRDMLENLPASGWLRANTDGNPNYACYHMKVIIKDGSNYKARFYLAPNGVTGNIAETKFAHDNAAVTTVSDKLYVWAKAGVIRYNNENASARDHMCQVHFSGIVDAVDRTRPIGAVGWHGERYSYLNSIKVGTTTAYAGGLGAYHPFLNFSPYGTAGTAMNVYGHLPIVGPLKNSPESMSVLNHGQSAANHKTFIDTPYSSNDFADTSYSRSYAYKDAEAAAPDNLSSEPANYLFSHANSNTYSVMEEELKQPQGVYASAFIVVSYESELALVAKRDRDGVKATGDWLYAKHGNSTTVADGGSTKWDERFHGQDRFIAPANAGPNVEALIAAGTAVPTASVGNNWIDSLFPPASGDYVHMHDASNSNADSDLSNATPDLNPTGDLLYDLDYSVGSFLLNNDEAERNVSEDKYSTAYTAESGFDTNFWMSDVNGFQTYSNTAAKNFTVENVVWKRMDGGNLSLPAINARGMGAVPFVTRVASNTAYVTGEKIYGNVRFSFETTNSSMMPVLQAQELSHPSLASSLPYKIQNVLQIPNEELQFNEMTVVDDAGKEHVIEGGSPLGTVIRTFSITRGAPSLAGSGNTPNLAVRLPNPDSIPGNIVVRSGFDPIQAIQSDTFGSGGMHHREDLSTRLKPFYDGSLTIAQKHPVYEEIGWDHLDIETKKPKVGEYDVRGHQSNYELHDRMLLFHVTKSGISHTHRYPTTYTHASGVENQSLTLTSFSSGTVTASATIDTDVFNADFGTKEENDNRRFIRMYDSSGTSGLASYTGISTNTFTGVKADATFTSLAAAGGTLTIVPSYPVPAGSNRFFAARRIRDHSEVSGNSPDMPHTSLIDGSGDAYDRYSTPKMTPMPYPRMGHHFVNATMPMLPGHWAHPAYQSLYRKHTLVYNASLQPIDTIKLKEGIRDAAEQVPVKSDLVTDNIDDEINVAETQLSFSAVNAAPSGPSDLHGGGFTLMVETGVRWDGYGVLASTGAGATRNQNGGHSIVLAAAKNYTLGSHFPDPAEVGAYQIVIQPNVFDNQIRSARSTDVSLTSQQVNTVIGIKHDESTNGGMTLVLARATDADTRGCEVYMNEVMLDISPDFGSQLTSVPPLLLYNAFGVNLNETPSFTRKSFPYTPMMSTATPAHTLNIPWYSVLFGNVTSDDISNDYGYRGLHRYTPHDYFAYSRSTYGSIGHTLTNQGYPTIYPDIYSNILQNTSPIAKCIVQSKNTSTGVITVDNASMFPSKPRLNEKLSYVAQNGKTYTATYTKRDGFDADEVNLPLTITVATGTAFLTNLNANDEIRLITNHNADNEATSIYARNMNTLAIGSRDTNNLHPPDAFMCLWHENLGRPYTYFSDNSSRNWDGAAVNAARYNALPEHYETIHYHSAVYAMSLGPFTLGVKSQTSALTGAVASDATSAYNTDVTHGGYWPCGSRGGPQSSSLDLYTMASVSWNLPEHLELQHKIWAPDSGNADHLSLTTASSGRQSFGYRISVRQAYNRPSWGLLPARAALENTSSGGSAVNTTDYDTGPIVQLESYTGVSQTYTGVLERSTNFTGMLNNDIAGQQVRYAQGRRMTRPFGAPLRTLRQPSGVERDWWGDGTNKGLTDLTEAAKYYIVDWWSNERGESVRRPPVRGFGIRPAWDCGNAYKDGSSATTNLFNEKGTDRPRFSGTVNTVNNHGTTTHVDVFAPKHSLRVGCMGNGRGVRYPTWFNECIFTDVSESNTSTGIVLSANTNDPLFGQGFVRARDDVLQADEVKRGISSRLGIDEDGLLKPEATVSSRTETISGTSKHVDAVSRASPRIGIDAVEFDGVEQNYVALNSEAHSLHTDRNVGQRVVFNGAFQRDGSISNWVTPTTFGRQSAGSPTCAVMRFSHTNPFRPYGGSYVMDVRSYSGTFDDTGWGKDEVASPTISTNPYQSGVRNRTNKKNNLVDKSVRFLIRPIRVLDNRHVELYRLNDQLTTTGSNDSPQTALSYLWHTSGGKYGLFNYEVDTPASNTLYYGGTGPDGDGPYRPVLSFSSDTFETLVSSGPTIKGSEVSNLTLSDAVGRVIITESTLQHHRADSIRNGDYSVSPRHSQTLHPKGHKEDI